jgi:hypothetical protein
VTEGWGDGVWGDGGWGRDQGPYAEPWHQQPAYADPAAHGFAPSQRPWRHRQKRALRCGIWSLVLLLCSAVALVGGILTFFAGGFVLLLAVIPLGIAAWVFALMSIGYAVRATGGPVGSRVLATIPAWLTIAALLPTVTAVLPEISPGGKSAREPVRRSVARELPRDAAPEEVVDEAGRLLWTGRYDEFCALLARRARTEGCARDAAFARDFPMPHASEPVRRSATRALVSMNPPFDDTDVLHRVRLVREAEGWQLLDVPLHAGECVDTAEDPFACPVHRHGSTPR